VDVLVQILRRMEVELERMLAYISALLGQMMM
jgi:hypothetical protein